MADIRIDHATVVTMDPDRRVLEDASIVVSGDKITAIGPSATTAPRHPAKLEINGRRMLALPGLIDAHAHAGHGLVKTLGGDDSAAWFEACRAIYTKHSSEAFWRAEARLSALERIKAGVTLGVSMFGRGDSVSRVDDPRYAVAHMGAVNQSGARAVLACGPCRPPFPWTYAHVGGPDDGEHLVDVDRMMEVTGTIIDRWHGAADGRLSVAVCYPVHHDGRPLPDGVSVDLIRAHAQGARALGRQKGVRFTQDGHRNGSLAAAHDVIGDLLGPDAYMSHCTDLTERDIAVVVETGTHIVHNPSAIAAIRGRCPVPELIDQGVTVAIGSDGTAPDRSFDMFRHMQQSMHYHRRHFRDDQILPPGKALEMVTIDAAQVLGVDDHLGSLEEGKQADITLLDMAKPHLTPANMPVYRAVYFANAADVDTVICNGSVLMRGRKVSTLEEGDVLDEAERETALMIERAGLAPLLAPRAGFWSKSRYDA